MFSVKRLILFFVFVCTFVISTPAIALDCHSNQKAFKHAGGETCIPKDPKRIISLHDQSITLELVELDAPVVGSMGRVSKKDKKSIYMRGVDLLFGLNFENSDIQYVGSWNSMDFEKMAVLKPDLIIGRAYDMKMHKKYKVIAPTIYIEDNIKDPMEFGRQIADAANKLDIFEAQLKLYKENIKLAKFALPLMEGKIYSKIQASRGKLTVYAGYGGLTKVLGDLGFVRTKHAQKLSDKGVVWGEKISAEILPQLQADYIFDTYTIAYGDTLASPSKRLKEMLPNWCKVLVACQKGKYIVLPREISTGFSFKQLNMLIHLITTNVANADMPKN